MQQHSRPAFNAKQCRMHRGLIFLGEMLQDSIVASKRILNQKMEMHASHSEIHCKDLPDSYSQTRPIGPCQARQKTARDIRNAAGSI